jgi:3-oxoacyl-[acyl-carrier protein] reductase
MTTSTEAARGRLTLGHPAKRRALEDRSVLITGGAGGLGAPTAQALAAAGARVVVLDRDASGGERLATDICGTGREAVFVHMDLSDTKGVLARVGELAARRTIDILVNNAAIFPSRKFSDYSLDEFELVQRVNVQAAFACCQAVLPQMVAQRWGRIINVSSITFYGGWAGIAPYVVSKGSLIALTRALAREYGSFGITANSICPGAFPTAAEDIQGDPEAYRQLVLQQQCIKRRGTPADFANAVLFFATDQSEFVTGQSLNVDGGWFMT